MDQGFQVEWGDFPRIYLHCTAFAAMSAGFLLTLALNGDLDRLAGAWGMIGVAWFPFACVEVFLRSRVERPIWPAAILSAMLGWDVACRFG